MRETQESGKESEKETKGKRRARRARDRETRQTRSSYKCGLDGWLVGGKSKRRFPLFSGARVGFFPKVSGVRQMVWRCARAVTVTPTGKPFGLFHHASRRLLQRRNGKGQESGALSQIQNDLAQGSELGKLALESRMTSLTQVTHATTLGPAGPLSLTVTQDDYVAGHGTKPNQLEVAPR